MYDVYHNAAPIHIHTLGMYPVLTLPAGVEYIIAYYQCQVLGTKLAG